MFRTKNYITYNLINFQIKSSEFNFFFSFLGLKSIFEEIGYGVEDFGHLKYDYDLIIKDDCENIDYKIEVKTATEGESGTFQHEGIKNSND